MNLWTALGRVMICAAGLWLAACTPPPAGTVDETKDPHFLRGQDLMTRLDYTGAIEAFEKTLENNPRSSAAHFELGFLYADEKKGNDPAAAIHHFDRFLRLRPKSDRADIVKNHIVGCKMELAKSLLLTTGAPSAQREIDRLKGEIERLTLEGAQFRRQLEAAGVRPPAGATNLTAKAPVVPPAPAPGDSARATNRTATAEAAKKPAPATTARTHAIKQGETPATVARHYGLKVEDLLAANPGLDPKRLKIGQVINLPAQ